VFLSALVSNLQASNSILSKIGHTFLNVHSLLILAACLLVGIIASNIVASFLQKLSLLFGKRADRATDYGIVTFMRRIETFLVLSMAIVRLAVIVLSLYVWWVLTHVGQQPSALIGASALALVIAYGLSGPLLRDVAFGSGMMAEQWFGVGDIVTIQPNNVSGVVERITLRSTRIRGFSGETVWYSNQNINMVSVVRKGTWAIALEIFVSDVDIARDLLEKTNKLLPKGPSLLISPLKITTVNDEGDGVHHITAIGETAPGRDYLLSTNAINIFTKLDSEQPKPILLATIIGRFADKSTEVQLARAVKNARKTKRPSATATITDKVTGAVLQRKNDTKKDE